MPELRPAGLIGSVERALGVLEAIADYGEGASAKTVARRAELPLPSAYRMLGTLHYHGYLTRHDDGGYGLGEQLASLYEHWCRRLDLDPAVRLVLRDVHDRAGVAACFGRLKDGEVNIADIVDNGAPIRSQYTAARLRSSGFRSAVGRALLAALPGEDRAEYIADHLPGTRMGPILDSVRRTGIAADVAEFAPGLASLAVAIHAPDGSLRGALSATMPVTDFPYRRAEAEQVLRYSAVRLTRLLAW
ncbi:IclR family transcriptional regulator [Longispora albida]|uniref:IclR family transcriptional regulator n=1 Tax=Longispora albida TaxID=203523 RepID=UPI0003633007|nr:helix-turn-helix domain-containing protein [Longispora albida]